MGITSDLTYLAKYWILQTFFILICFTFYILLLNTVIFYETSLFTMVVRLIHLSTPPNTINTNKYIYIFIYAYAKGVLHTWKLFVINQI